jgi:hypothetical protein
VGRAKAARQPRIPDDECIPPSKDNEQVVFRGAAGALNRRATASFPADSTEEP